eukprot:CAMPEP_0204607742 /NCGR_PEP_ID=MMETSP0661-20131031/59895_1 /ASSEMBLY_ACC=CAM_ASM_000606 /TAXON_ID=109239 /ORGANISM="Alexandrium margalefi, Strain AMGDE01CS-322" /LENGTH=110 /DNA_ID=CAMNT_0051619179 /DNA_START=64 /DNA_END=396 /DNA_ORIENTATION=+
MARSRSSLLALVLAASAALHLCAGPVFLAPPRAAAAQEVDARVVAAAFAGLAPLAVEQPAAAYDSVVAMLQSWLVGGTVLTLIFAAALVAATANPLTKRRTEVAAAVEKK